MGSDSRFTEFSGPNKFEDEIVFPVSDQYQNVTNGFKLEDLEFDFVENPLVLPDPDPGNSALSSIRSIDGDSPSDDNDSDNLLKYISQVLMEENMEEKALTCPTHPMNLLPMVINFWLIAQTIVFGVAVIIVAIAVLFLILPVWLILNGMASLGNPNHRFMQMPLSTDFVFQSAANPSSQSSFKFHNGLASDSAIKPSVGNIVVPNIFSDSDFALQFKRGVEEASKFLPKGKKNHEREDGGFEEERSNKQSAVYIDECELVEQFESGKALRQNGQTKGTNGSKTRAKRRGDNKEVVDLRTLLILCAQAVSVNDRRTATELLKQIRQHSSPLGDGSQRLAHCFANGLEARLDGTGTHIYTALSVDKTSAVDMLKAYQAYIFSLPV
ncbi:SCARECROW-LIKE PROTEIN 14 [Salix viminalis]|uniref:SCARECROW-LIKE PROTEIN 14 n=1 Tax=Salix viminalis TaxID=40686 RepID=A0A9Q0SBA9_SALVM|nr:SCARECROW-LIKE PROTEIN 14 [Salix viminalis]